MNKKEAEEIVRRPKFDVVTGEVEIKKLYSSQDHNHAIAFLEGYAEAEKDLNHSKVSIDGFNALHSQWMDEQLLVSKLEDELSKEKKKAEKELSK